MNESPPKPCLPARNGSFIAGFLLQSEIPGNLAAGFVVPPTPLGAPFKWVLELLR